jgi:arsenate reductase
MKMDKKRVLFLCTGNSARSQMAEGLLRHLASDKFEAFSAGVSPAGVNRLAIKAMAEISIDIGGHRSKGVEEFSGQSFDYVITLCDSARQVCPVFPSKYGSIHWNLEDPVLAEGTEDEKIRVFRKTRDQIKENIINLLGKAP